MELTEPLPLKGKQILIVEDQYLIATDLSRAVTKLGGTVVGPVASIEAAQAQIAQTRIDLAFLDINLNDQMAFPLADELERHQIPFIFSTGYDMSLVPDRFRSRLRLEKPFTGHSIREAVRQLVPAG